MKKKIEFMLALVLSFLCLNVFAGDDFCSNYFSYKNSYFCYGTGNCTWWAYHKRSDLAPHIPHNAVDWYSEAEQNGLIVSQNPSVGSLAIFRSIINGKDYGHVAYVEQIFNSNSFQLSEMGYNSWNGVRYKTHTKNSYHGLIGFIHENLVGQFTNGWRIQNQSSDQFIPYSRPFFDCFMNNGSVSTLGNPINSVQKQGSNFYSQIFNKGSYECVLVLNPYVHNINRGYLGVCYPVQSAHLRYWRAYNPGAPVTNEYYWDYNGRKYAVQWFEPSDNLYIGVAYDIHSGVFYTSQELPIPQENFNQHRKKNSGYPGIGGGVSVPFPPTPIPTKSSGSSGGSSPPPAPTDIPTPVPTLVPTSLYTHTNSYVCEDWEAGAEQYSLVPINPKTVFPQGSVIKGLVELRDIKIKFRTKWEAYRGSQLVGEETKDWENIDNEHWSHSYCLPYIGNAQIGEHEFKTYIDIGNGFQHLDSLKFTVEQVEGYRPYTHSNSWVCADLGIGAEEYMKVPIDIRTTFQPGETVYGLVELRNISVDFRYYQKAYYNGKLIWEYTGELGKVEPNIWGYSSSYPCQIDVQSGQYKFEVYIDIGNGLELIDALEFTVESIPTPIPTIPSIPTSISVPTSTPTVEQIPTPVNIPIPVDTPVPLVPTPTAGQVDTPTSALLQ